MSLTYHNHYPGMAEEKIEISSGSLRGRTYDGVSESGIPSTETKRYQGRSADILSASGRSPVRLSSEDSLLEWGFARRTQADRMSALHD